MSLRPPLTPCLTPISPGGTGAPGNPASAAPTAALVAATAGADRPDEAPVVARKWGQRFAVVQCHSWEQP